ncbi:hypothetical protein EX30DRAFT_338294 [Ascodesmis nigricans]|uniref:C2H2-type domain-containing protein n=1 Tax=Ascodesmis nigricans TaxID=341454 RepID=A0A4S2N3C8_9PEZI|nr:hypothetical protein EX30DRAFT_338294 [Ascodesmis nigricans]
MVRFHCVPPCNHSTTSPKAHHKHQLTCRHGPPVTRECASECPRAPRRPQCKTRHLRKTSDTEGAVEPTYHFSRPFPAQTCCYFCGAHFYREELLDRHFYKQHTCHVDGMFFISPTNLQRHIRVEHTIDSRAIKPCHFPNCSYRFPTTERILYPWVSPVPSVMELPDYQHHMETAHAFCTQCQQSFNTKPALSQHLADSPFHQTREYRCIDCESDFASINELVYHKCRFPCGEKTETFTCEAVFGSRAALEKHQRRCLHGPYADDPEAKVVKCRPCNRKFVDAAAMVAHLESGRCKSGMKRGVVDLAVMAFDKDGVVHDGDGVRRMVKEEERMRMERKRIEFVDEVDGRRWRCEICGKKFKMQKGLEMHLESPVHREKVYHCPPQADKAEREDIGEAPRVFEVMDDEEVEEIVTKKPKRHQHSKRFKTASGLAQHFQNNGCKEMEMMHIALEQITERVDALMIQQKESENDAVAVYRYW